ncbi:hypothetical protein B4N89_38045 [Embleya scabrispora]|uniref:Uncharacterized protein n=1 Tax=Embleya scabrispora TaxID=159449 RepID=A0A1T3NMR7_9ACTN|nr:hypothetical protein [Embleya scabrispora]OPC78022.1 hypothetical protein B4N89_38045 [Embleya scabrispora]
MSDPLALPFVDEAEDGELDPNQVPLGATVRVPAYAGMAAGDVVTVRWEGSDGAVFEESAPVPGKGVGHPVVFRIPACELLPHIGSVIRLSYDVDGAAPAPRRSSDVVAVRVDLRERLFPTA